MEGELRVTVTIVLNASFTWPEGREDAPHALHAAALAFACVAALLLNVCLLSAVLRPRRSPFLAGLAITCALDSLFGALVAIRLVRAPHTVSGACVASALCACFASFAAACALCGMCLQRWGAERGKMCALGVAVPAGFCALLAICVATGAAEARVCPGRLACALVARERSCRTALLACLAAPAALGLAALALASARAVRPADARRAADLSYEELFFSESNAHREWQHCKFVAGLLLLFLVLQGPFATVNLGNIGDPVGTNNTADDPRSGGRSLHHPTPGEGTFYTWCKFLFDVLLPVACFGARKDIRRKLGAALSVCRPGSSIPEMAAPRPDAGVGPDDFLVPRAWRRRRLSSVTRLSPPVVFAGSSARFQMLDFSTGMRGWTSNYDLPDGSASGELFPADFECGGFEDGAEEEINSSDDPATGRREVAVQTVPEVPARRRSPSSPNGRPLRCASRALPAAPPSGPTSDLLRALRAYRSRKHVTACDVLPRGTAELVDSTSGSKNVMFSSASASVPSPRPTERGYRTRTDTSTP